MEPETRHSYTPLDLSKVTSVLSQSAHNQQLDTLYYFLLLASNVASHGAIMSIFFLGNCQELETCHLLSNGALSPYCVLSSTLLCPI